MSDEFKDLMREALTTKIVHHSEGDSSVWQCQECLHWESHDNDCLLFKISNLMENSGYKL